MSSRSCWIAFELNFWKPVFFLDSPFRDNKDNVNPAHLSILNRTRMKIPTLTFAQLFLTTVTRRGGSSSSTCVSARVFVFLSNDVVQHVIKAIRDTHVVSFRKKTDLHLDDFVAGSVPKSNQSQHCRKLHLRYFSKRV